MSESKEDLPEPAKMVWTRGLGYEFKGEHCEVHCFLLDDNGVQWLFRRGNREFRVRLSPVAMECVCDLWQRATWEAPLPSPTDERR